MSITSDTLKTVSPLVNKVILTWLTNSYVYYKAGPAAAAAAGIAKPQGIGYGIGLGFALFAMQGKCFRASPKGPMIDFLHCRGR